MSETSDQNEWYAEGLHFTCTQCGNCCTGSPGYVWFHYDELLAMAEYVGETPDVFLEKYARQVDGDWTLIEINRGGLHDCVFLETDEATGRRTCSIYPVRPQQCRTWPFWPDNLASKRAWKNTARHTPCPGMMEGVDGKGTFFPIEKIRIQRDATPQ